MKNKTKYKVGYLKSICFFILLLVFSSCKKFLDESPDRSLVIPSTLEDLQAMLSNNTLVNSDPLAPGEFSSDNMYLTQPEYDGNNTTEFLRRMYIWGENIFPPSSNNWSTLYDRIYICNTALKALNDIARTEANKVTWDYIKGQALLIRGKSFFEGVIIWCLAYDPATAATDLGLPLRLDPDFNLPSVRSSLEQTYTQILSDLNESVPLLGQVVPTAMVRSSRAAAYGYLSRVYLTMRDYANASKYADLCLTNTSASLLNYDLEIPVLSQPPYNATNVATGSTNLATFTKVYVKEVVMHSYSVGVGAMLAQRGRVDSNLYASYATNDTRKQYFFRNNGTMPATFGFKGNYSTVNGQLFSNITVGEMYLVRAECSARAGLKDSAINDLEKLLKCRMMTNSYVRPNPATALDAFNLILVERRKELLYRGLRWMDIKRLNKEGANISVKKFINNTLFTLPPNDPRFALQLPVDVIALSGMEQNPR